MEFNPKNPKKNTIVIGLGSWGKNHIRTLYEMDCLGGIVESDKNTKAQNR